MISTRVFAPLLFFAIALIFLQLISGGWLFVEKFGILPSDVYAYFAGDESRYILPKSIEGLLETAVPHFIAMSTTLFVYGHFLLFTSIIKDETKQLLMASLFITAIIDILAPFGIIQGWMLFAYAKVIAFWSFEFLMGLLLYTLFQAQLLALRSQDA